MTNLIPNHNSKKYVGQQINNFIHFLCISFFLNIFIYLTASGLSVACGIYFPDQGSNLGSLLWEHGVVATGPPGKSHISCVFLKLWQTWSVF